MTGDIGMRRTQGIVAVALGALLLGAGVTAEATSSDACQKLYTSNTIQNLQRYTDCRFDRIDAAQKRIEDKLNSAPVTPSPSPTVQPTSPAPTTPAPTTPAPTVDPTTPAPTQPPAPPSPDLPATPTKVCGTDGLNGPATAPAGAITVPAGDNSGLTPNWNGDGFSQANKVFWFAPGVHTVGSDEFAQIQPGAGTTFIGAPGAIIDGQKKNLYAFAGRNANVTIKYLTVRNFIAPLDQGTVNHDAGDGWKIEHNTITLNGGAGVFLGNDNTATGNCLKDNSQYGFQGSTPGGAATNIELTGNEISGNNTGDWETKQPGCGCTGGGKFWDARNVKVVGNYVHDNKSVGLWADTNNNNFLFAGNWIEDNDGQAVFWEISYNAAIRNNVMRHNLIGFGQERIASGDNFPDAAIYISESGGDSRLPSTLVGSATVDISGNLIENNYNGIALWENADRFCGSPSNTSTGYCTLVNPDVTLATCNATNISKQPYLSDCRWKTQNVKVHDNTFKMDRTKFFDCKPAMCGRNAVFANWGSEPSWSPYKGDGTEKAISQTQGNVFSNNTYTGTWNFTVPETSKTITSAAWQATGQDIGSKFN